MFEVLILAQSDMQIPHTSRKMFTRNIVDHVLRKFATKAAVNTTRYLSCDSGQEALGEMRDNGQKSVIFVKSGNGPRRCLERLVQPRRVVLENNGGLKSGWNICVTSA